MSKRHFFKHLSYALLPGLICPPSSFSPLSNCKTRCLPVWKSSSSLISTISTPSVRSFTSVPVSQYTPASTESSVYLSVRIRCPKDVADMLSEALLCSGASSASMDEECCCETSNEICIDSIFSECQDVNACLSRAANSIGLKEIPAYEVKMGKQCDWIQKIQESFHPIEVTEGLWIVPEWKTPLDDRSTNIVLNPGLAFGTGEHPTTKLCLLLLQQLIKGGELFLDYGTGSGILAIAALKFGAALSVGFDVDPQAITSARYNAALNNIGPQTMQLHLVSGKTSSPLINERTDAVVKEQGFCKMGTVSTTEKYDIVIANILLNPLLELADHIVSYAKPGAVVAISGILSEQLPYIMDRYSVLLEDISVSELDDWACASGRKKNNLNIS